MSKLIDVYKSIVLKQKPPEDWEKEFISFIYVAKMLSLDINNLPKLKVILKDCWYLSPCSLYCLLFYNIPRKENLYRVNFPKKVVKDDEEDILYKKIQEVLDWTNKELKVNKNILEKVIDKEYWNNEFGIETKKRRK